MSIKSAWIRNVYTHLGGTCKQVNSGRSSEGRHFRRLHFIHSSSVTSLFTRAGRWSKNKTIWITVIPSLYIDLQTLDASDFIYKKKIPADEAKLKWQCHEIFWPFFLWNYPTWALDKQAIMVLLTDSFSRRCFTWTVGSFINKILGVYEVLFF